MTIRKNPDTEQAQRVQAALALTEGYCPCALERTPDTKCMCRQFREQEAAGLCHCGLYLKEEE